MGEAIGIHDRPLNPATAIARIRKRWEEGNVEWTAYFQKRMRVRRITFSHVQAVIRYGRVVGNRRKGDLWRYSVEGETADRGKLRIVVEIHPGLILITAYPRRKRRKR